MQCEAPLLLSRYTARLAHAARTHVLVLPAGPLHTPTCTICSAGLAVFQRLPQLSGRTAAWAETLRMGWTNYGDCLLYIAVVSSECLHCVRSLLCTMGCRQLHRPRSSSVTSASGTLTVHSWQCPTRLPRTVRKMLTQAALLLCWSNICMASSSAASRCAV